MFDRYPSTWRRATLGDVADVNWGDTSVTKASYVSAGYTAYSASGPDGLLPYADFDRTGVVLSAIGANCGRTWLARGKWSCIKNTIRFWSTDEGVDTEFLYWLTRNGTLWRKSGTAQPFISQRDARSTPIAYPSVVEQLRIVAVLRSLHDQMQLNGQMNRTLEATARAIFRSWFVDFDPVVAKAEGRKPFGMDAETAGLFPDRFVDSELGPVPDRWDVRQLGDMCHLAYGKSLPKRARIPGPFPVYGSGGVDGSHETALVKGPGLVIGRKGTIGTVWFEHRDFFPIDTTYYIASAKSPLPWLYFLLQELGLQRLGSHSAVPGLNRDTLYAQSFPQPPKDLMERFHTLSQPMFELIWTNEAESRIVASLRDLLLPKLLSGEIRVREAEEAVSDPAAAADQMSLL